MKKYLLFIAMLICILLPIQTKADLLPPIPSVYVSNATVDSTIIYKLDGTVWHNYNDSNSTINGEISYDASQLEFLNIDVSYQGSCYYDECGTYSSINVVSKTEGSVKYVINTEEGEVEDISVYAKFKVKMIPDTGNIKIKFIPDNLEVLDDNLGYMETAIEVFNPINNSDHDTTKEERKKENNQELWLYIAIATVAVLDVTLIVILISKSKKEKTNNLNQNQVDNQNLNNNLSENNNINNNLNN